MRFRGKQQRIRYRRRPCVRRLLLSISLVAIAFVLSACGSDASDSISVLSPSYGAGTVRLGVELESNYVEDSLEVSLDRRLITDAFEFDGRVVLDLAYIERRSLRLDLMIVVRTFFAIWKDRGTS